MMSRLSSAVKRHPPLCAALGLQSPSLACTHADLSRKG
jgi:hypothetical protein